MSEQHTPGRLSYEYEPGYCGELIASNGTTICTFSDEPSKANARRLVACWNLLDGMPTSDIEGSALPEIIQNLLVAKGQRDELLQALEHALQWNDDAEPMPVWVHEARAAIAKAGGGV